MGHEGLLEGRSGTAGTSGQTAAVPSETASPLAWTPGTPGTAEKVEGEAENIPAALAQPDLPGVPPELAARLSAEDRADIASGDLTAETLQAFEQYAPDHPAGR